jgi:hypothetical protein
MLDPGFCFLSAEGLVSGRRNRIREETHFQRDRGARMAPKRPEMGRTRHKRIANGLRFLATWTLRRAVGNSACPRSASFSCPKCCPSPTLHIQHPVRFRMSDSSLRSAKHCSVQESACNLCWRWRLDEGDGVGTERNNRAVFACENAILQRCDHNRRHSDATRV